MPVIGPQISIGTVRSLPRREGKLLVRGETAPHTEFSFCVHYLGDEGKLQVPVAGEEGDACEVVAWAAPYMQKLVVWMAQRLGAIPVLPDFEEVTANEELLKTHIGGTAPMLMPGNVHHHFVTWGAYLFALKVPKTKDTGFPFGRVPFDKTPASAHVARSNNFGKMFS